MSIPSSGTDQSWVFVWMWSELSLSSSSPFSCFILERVAVSEQQPTPALHGPGVVAPVSDWQGSRSIPPKACTDLSTNKELVVAIVTRGLSAIAAQRSQFRLLYDAIYQPQQCPVGAANNIPVMFFPRNLVKQWGGFGHNRTHASQIVVVSPRLLSNEMTLSCGHLTPTSIVYLNE